jgi:purine-binding chemotaxis protein CheW
MSAHLAQTGPTEAAEGLVSVRIGRQVFGVPVLSVQDVIAQTAINRVPLGPPEVAGSLNLRGRIVTAIDMRQRLGMEARAPGENHMAVIVERNGELYALLVDDVGDVLWLAAEQHEAPPATLSAKWRRLCQGLYRLEGDLLLVLNVQEVLVLDTSAVAASPPPAAEPASRAERSLFERVGGAPAIEALVETFHRRLMADAQLSGFFKSVDMERQAHSQRAFLTMIAGGPGAYTGANLRAAHARLVARGLNDAHFDGVIGHLTASLGELDVPAAETSEVLGAAERLRNEVLGR